MAPMSMADGKRTIPAMGNAGQNTQWGINLPTPLPEDIYYSIQTIDNGFLASEWAPEKSEISKFVADFTPNSACQKNEIQFQDKSYSVDYPITGYQWKFIERDTVRATSTLQNPKYAFQTYPGKHQVELTITNGNGEIISRTKTITVLPSPVADFTALPVCQGTLTSITNTTLSNTTKITGWLWNFGDGTPNSTTQNPGTHGYNPGSYNLSLTVNADNGCSLTATKEVLIAELPSKLLSIIGNTISCSNENTSLSADNKNFYTYQWKTNGAIMPDSIKYNLYPKSGSSYSVAITNTQADNCITQSDPVVLTVKPSPPALSIIAPQGTTFCLNDAASQFTAPQVSGLTYNWMVNGNLAMSGSNIYLPQQSGSYTLSVSNSDNCSQVSSNSVPNIVINPIPAVPNVTSPTPTFCSGTAFTLETPFSNEFTYQWLDNGIIVPGATQNIFSPGISGKYSAKITKNGCSNSSLPTDVTVLPAPASPTIISQGSIEFCQGDSLELSAPVVTGITYQWKLNGGALGSNQNTFIAKTSGLYSLVVTNSSGCSANSTNTINVTVNPKPALPTVNISGPTTFCSGESITLSIPSNSAYSYNWRNENGLISGANTNSYLANTSGKYQLDISNASGCVIKTATVNIAVKPMPYKPVVASDNYQPGKCLGETPIRLNVNQVVSGYNYQWYKNGVPISSTTSSYLEGFLSQGDYSLEADLGGCKSQSDILNIYFENAPEKPLIYAEGRTLWYLACSNDSASQYKWYYNGILIPGADKYLYVANRNLGKYNVSIANTKGCYTMSDTLKIPTGATGIEDVDPSAGLNIYPNPTTGMFTIEMGNQIFGELMVRIFDQGGKEILNIKFEKTTEHFSSQIDLSGQGKGMYLILFKIDKYLATRKLLVD
jgi:PKD repeat protein